ncbi:hypothetical protein DX116_08390 [Aeromicrobium endophyticum]|uniref:Uncharacterized protein n=1 Tax=Aeromicrobium endophyticum TaxID=2292704 RepID=A0A371PCB0_9ACTN|nr:hypothetical protein DX116_08390 [Aeromicrobium endophyticum]
MIVVGPPAGLTTSIVPSKAVSRRATPDNPVPDGDAPPTPSSSTTTTRARPSWLTSIETRSAAACLPTLASSSLTAKYTADSTGAGARPASTIVVDTGTAMSSANAWTAPASPRSASTGGWMPRTTDRRSPRADVVTSRASVSRRAAASGSFSSSSAASPRFMPSATSRACAPSCRSRSMRRSSAAEWSIDSARDCDTSATRRSRAARDGASIARSSCAMQRTRTGSSHHHSANTTGSSTQLR